MFMKHLLDFDLLQTLIAEVLVGVLVVAWLEVRRMQRKVASLRHHLAEKWRIYVRLTESRDEEVAAQVSAIQMHDHVRN